MDDGQVAENMSVWRSARMLPAMVRMCGSKPKSSILSASSSTKYVTSSSEQMPSPIKSSSRPGVATTMLTPERRAWACSLLGTPPYTHTHPTPTLLPASSSTTLICSASSLVGAMTSATGLVPDATPASICARMCLMAGKPNASVFPLPVAAIPTRSLPDRAIGRHCDWIGDGIVKFRVAYSSSFDRPDCLKLDKGFASQFSTAIRLSSRNASMLLSDMDRMSDDGSYRSLTIGLSFFARSRLPTSAMPSFDPCL